MQDLSKAPGRGSFSAEAIRRLREDAMSKSRAAIAAATILVFLGAQTAGAMSVPDNLPLRASAQDGATLTLAACEGPKCKPPAMHRPAGPPKRGNFKPRPPSKPRPPGRPHHPGKPIPGRPNRPPPGRPRPPPHHHRPPNYRPVYRPWRNQAYFGAIFAGVTLGAIIATAANAPPPPPSPDLCWYWSDPSFTSGYWDYCP
jgi:hypothetical protein